MDHSKGLEHLQVLLAGTIGMGILVISLILFVVKYQKRKIQEQEARRKLIEENQNKVLEAILQTQENERKRIARDLHDELGSALSIAKLNIGFLSKNIIVSEDQEIVKETYSILEDTLKNVRRLSKDLHPVMLEKYGLEEALKVLGGNFSSQHLEVKIHFNQTIERLPDYQELNIFRIIQELLNNALKHSQASLLEVWIESKQDQLSISYSDNGIGFKYNKHYNSKVEGVGIGMVTIDTRVRILKGSWKLESIKGKGTSATFCFPLENTTFKE